jgi:Protein of unknown function (DUF3987)
MSRRLFEILGSNGTNGTVHHSEIEEAMNWLWLVPREPDVRVLFHCVDVRLPVDYWARDNLDRIVRRQRVILLVPDGGPLYAPGILAAKKCGETAAEVILWELSGYREDRLELQVYDEEHGLGFQLERQRPWTFPPVPRPEAGDIQVTGELKPPEFEGKPRPLQAALLPVPPLDPEIIPAPLRRWLQDINERGSFCPEFAVVTAIVMLAGIKGRRVAIRPKLHDDWLVVGNLWGALVADSGQLKSPPVLATIAPIERIEQALLADYHDEMEQFEAAKMVAQVQTTLAKQRIRRGAKTEFRTKEELRKIAEQANLEAAIKPPAEPRITINDSTLARLQQILADNPNGLIVYRDELIAFLRSLDMQGHEGDRGFLLECWNGVGSHVVDRIGRDQVRVANKCLSLFGTITPGPLASYLRESFGGRDADGFIPRFQLMVYPDPRAKYVPIDRPPDADAADIAYRIYSAISKLNPGKQGCKLDKRHAIPYLQFAGDAQEYFNSWRQRLEERLISGEVGGVIRSHLSKYRSLLPALALTFHLIETARKRVLPPVSLPAIKLAARWVDWLEAHMQRLYCAAHDGDPDGPTMLARRLRSDLPNPFTVRNIQVKGWSGLITQDEIRRALGVLEDRNWIKPGLTVIGPKGGRPSEIFWIHPSVRKDSGA